MNITELLKAIHNNLTDISVKGEDVFKLAGAIQLVEQAIVISENPAPEAEPVPAPEAESQDVE